MMDNLQLKSRESFTFKKPPVLGTLMPTICSQIPLVYHQQASVCPNPFPHPSPPCILIYKNSIRVFMCHTTNHCHTWWYVLSCSTWGPTLQCHT